MKKFKRKKAIYNEEIEKQLSYIFNYYDCCETKEDENITSELFDLYKETNYPGILFHIGEIYLFGQYKCKKDEEKAIKYFDQAANDGYLEAMELLGQIYKDRAQKELEKARHWFDMMGLDYNDAYGKFNLGSTLIAHYLILPSYKQQDHYHQYYDGLGLIAESFQMGCDDANTILKVLDKDKEFVNDYKNKIKEEQTNYIHKLYSYPEENLDISLENEFDEFLNDEGEYPF